MPVFGLQVAGRMGVVWEDTRFGGDSGDVGLASDLLSDSHKVEIQTPDTIHDIGSAFALFVVLLVLDISVPEHTCQIMVVQRTAMPSAANGRGRSLSGWACREFCPLLISTYVHVGTCPMH